MTCFNKSEKKTETRNVKIRKMPKMNVSCYEKIYYICSVLCEILIMTMQPLYFYALKSIVIKI